MMQNMEYKQRSLPQNNSLHKYCTELAEMLNESGITQDMFLRGASVDNSMQSVKALFRAMGNKRFLKKSTSELTTIEMTQVFDEMTRHLANNPYTGPKGIYVDWPSEENENFKQSYNPN